jgi:GT2 family glycosyltransferase/ubiquinone/menaquinone biosynthesis C-methylase UbiE
MLEWTGERYIPGEGGPEIFYEHAHRYLFARSLVAGRAVLDLASGEGYGTSWLASTAASAHGIDIEPAAVEHARERYGSLPGVEFSVGDILAVPFPDASFDAVVCFEAIEHVADPARVLDEIVRVLRPGGIALVSTPDKATYTDAVDHQNEFHVHELYRDEFEELLRARFGVHRLLGQRVVAGSVLLPEPADPDAPVGLATARADDHAPGRGVADVAGDATYYVAVCAREPDHPVVAGLGGSVFVDQQDLLLQRYHAVDGPAVVSNLLDQATELRSQLDRAVEQLARYEDELRALQERHGHLTRDAARALEEATAELRRSLGVERRRAADAVSRWWSDSALIDRLAVEVLEAHRRVVDAQVRGVELDEGSSGRGLAANLTVAGYWIVSDDGVAHPYGSTGALGERGAVKLPAVRPLVAVVAVTDGLVALTDDGGVCTLGAAPFHGSLVDVDGHAPPAGIAPTPTGDGYWILDHTGGVFAFGDAPFHGSLPGAGVTTRAVHLAPTPTGDGYWILDHTGGVFAFGGAPFRGSLPGAGVEREAVALLPDPAGEGYLVATADGIVAPFGLATFLGSPVGTSSGRVVAIVPATAPAPGSSRLDAARAHLDRAVARASGAADVLGPGSLALPAGGVVVPTSGSPRASIVIPVHGKAAYTARCLMSIAATGGEQPFEVIVVDDRSPDDTIEVLERVSGIRVLRNPQNLGFLESCNLGAAATRGDVVVLLNNDTEVADGWLDALVDRLDGDPSIGLVGAQLVYPDGTLQEAGGIVFSDGTGWNYGKGDDPDASPYRYAREVDYCSGAAIAVRRDVWERVGGFDTRYVPAYYEDTDLAFAVRAIGLRVVYEPRSRVVHHEGISHGTDVSSGVKRHQEVNRERFVEKWAHVLGDQQEADPANVGVARQRVDGARVVVFDHQLPTWDQDAGSLRMYELLVILRELGCAVTFVPDNRYEFQPYLDTLQARGVEVVHGTIDIGEHLRAIGPALDLAILSRPEVAWRYIRLVRQHAPHARVAFDTVDLHHIRESRRAALSADPEAERLAAMYREMELGLVRACDATITVTDDERRIVAAEVPGASVFVIPTIHRLVLDGPGSEGRSGILFVGGFRHPPNEDAVVWFAHEVFPLILDAAPGTTLTIAGSAPSDRVLALASDHVAVLGFVPDLEPLYRTARVVVAPIRYGAGMKGKVAEALAHGLPVVTTTVGAEGMGLEDGVHALVRDDAKGFADALVDLLTDPVSWASLREAGRILVREQFSPETTRARLVALLHDLGIRAPEAPGDERSAGGTDDTAADRVGSAVRSLADPSEFPGRPFLAGTCNICGDEVTFLRRRGVWLRETLMCPVCLTTSRNRSIARGLLEAIRELTGVTAQSIRGLPASAPRSVRILDTQPSFSSPPFGAYPIPRLLAERSWLEVQTSRFDPDLPWGHVFDARTTNQDLQALTLPDESLDILVTSDVLEHVRLDERALHEIARVLRPGGYHLFTVPHDRTTRETVERVLIHDPDDPSRDEHVLEPEYHGSPESHEAGILAYRVYGTDLDDRLAATGLDVSYTAAPHYDAGILETELFSCRKRPAEGGSR